MKEINGGPAFPNTGVPATSTYQYLPHPGMSLRDWFAGRANESDILEYRLDAYGELIPGVTREMAKYRYADNMLKAREQ